MLIWLIYNWRVHSFLSLGILSSFSLGLGFSLHWVSGSDFQTRARRVSDCTIPPLKVRAQTWAYIKLLLFSWKLSSLSRTWTQKNWVSEIIFGTKLLFAGPMRGIWRGYFAEKNLTRGLCPKKFTPPLGEIVNFAPCILQSPWSVWRSTPGSQWHVHYHLFIDCTYIIVLSPVTSSCSQLNPMTSPGTLTPQACIFFPLNVRRKYTISWTYSIVTIGPFIQVKISRGLHNPRLM